jgi:hypothetical protein
MPSGSEPAPSRIETPASLRQMGFRARRLAANILLDERTITSLIAFAEEVEAQATAMETAPKTDLIP